MTDKLTETMITWMPTWFWRMIHTPWFCATMMGLAGYNMAGLINDVTGTIPFWARLTAAVLSGIMVRWGLALDRRQFARG